MKSSRQRFMVLIKTTVLALIIPLIPVSGLLAVIAPFWGCLFFSYWLIFYCQSFPLLAAFIVGVLIDLVTGDILGQNALALVVSSGFLLAVKQRFLFGGIFTQQAFIFLASFLYLLVYLAIHISLVSVDIVWLVFLSPLISAVLWFFVGFLQRK